jgi:DNA polymerase III subunit gamma/tau
MRELHLEARPQSFKEVVGQDDACRQLAGLGASGNMPHCLLFSGPAGCGKTTTARIVRKKLGCGDADFVEKDASSDNGVDMVRDIQSRVGLAPIDGKCRVWLIDECQQLTSPAQGAFLKLLEEPPNHVYFMLATTNPEKLREAIRTRATEIKFKRLSKAEVCLVVSKANTNFECGVSSAVLDKISESVDGSARKALVLLQQVSGIEDEVTQLRIVENADAAVKAFAIAQAIQAKKPWPAIAALVRACEDEPESIRWMMMSYFTKVALGGGKGSERAVDILEEFRDNYYDTKKAGLVISCYRAAKL